jgi:hypothetical protein
VKSSRWIAPAIVAAVCSSSLPARATPQPLPFTYVYETLPEGSAEVEQYVDLVPEKSYGVGEGKTIWYLASQLQTEIEYGITDRLELAVYLALKPTPSADIQDPAPLTEGTGMKERLRYRIADEGVLPVDIGLYGEVVEYENEFELEAKILLQKRIGDLRIDANLWAEREWYYGLAQQDWVFNPTLGATYQISPLLNLGVDSWLRAEVSNPPVTPRVFSQGPQVYVGPAVMLDFGKIWWTVGAYIRTTDIGQHAAAPGGTLPATGFTAGDNLGPVWFRSVLGIGF